jgi:hypothetical protein
VGTVVGLGVGWEGGQGVQAVETLLGADISSTAVGSDVGRTNGKRGGASTPRDVGTVMGTDMGHC